MKTRLTTALFLFLVGLAQPVLGQVTTNWLNSEGFFADENNWSNGVPKVGDTAVFSNGGAYQSILTEPEQVLSLRVNGGTGVALVSDGLGLTTGSAIVNGAGALTIGSNTILDVNLLEVADVTDGQVVVAEGGSLKVNGNGVFGVSLGETGFLSVDSNALMTAFNLTLGQLGNATATFTNASGGFDTVILGDFAPANGSASLSNSDWDVDELIVGDDGLGLMVLDGNSNLQADNLTLGRCDSSDGSLTLVDGMVEVLVGELIVGDEGTGILDVRGDSFVSSQDTKIGDSAGSQGEASMVDDSVWNCAGSLTVGVEGEGDIDLFDESRLNVEGVAIIGGSNPGQVWLRAGGNPALTINNDFAIGDFSDGQLNISSGRVIVSGSTFSGAQSDSFGQINIIGSNSEMDIAGDFVAGLFADTNLAVLNGATLNVGNELTLGEEFGVSVNATFSESFVSVFNDFVVGDLFSNAEANALFSGGQMQVMGSVLINSNSQLEINSTGFHADQGLFNDGVLRLASGAGLEPFDFAIVNASDGQMEILTIEPTMVSQRLENNGVIIIPNGQHLIAATDYSGFGDVIGAGRIDFQGTVRPGNHVIGSLEFGQSFGSGLVVNLIDADLQIQAETVNDTDRLTVFGQLNILSNSKLSMDFESGFSPAVGETYVLCNVAGDTNGEFSNFSQGDVVRLFDDVALVIDYDGGVGGNSDIVLDAVDRTGLVLLGDVNRNGEINLLDVGPFVDLITGGGYLPEADCNTDGSVDLLDVGVFVSLLTGG